MASISPSPQPEAAPAATADAPEISVVMPCLNEADTLAACIGKAQAALRDSGIRGEIILADNGSSDASVAIAEKLGARVVAVAARGYGHALMGGIGAARGRFVLIGDADDSYDFQELPRFIERLRAGCELVQGCRLPRGGGTIRPGAMPFLHRWWGNPMFSWMVRVMFGAPIHDVNCGMRAFSRTLYQSLALRCTGMEFAVEMVIKSSLRGARIAEVPITLHPDGRKAHAPHLKTFRDGWRTLRFLLMYSPQSLFLAPGLLLVLLGLVGYALAMPALQVLGATLDVHTLLFASLAILMGYQSILFAMLAEAFALDEGLLPARSRLMVFFSFVSVEHALVAGVVVLLAGAALLLAAVHQWWRVNFGNLNYAQTMRLVIPGMMLAALGFQTILAGFLASLLSLRGPRSASGADQQ